MQLIDTHLHLIDRTVGNRAWMARAPALQRDFLLPEARALYAGHVAGSIFMEVDVDERDIAAEAEWVAGMVREGALLGQIAACRPENATGLEAWLERARGLGVVGLRRILHEIDEHLSESDLFRANVRKIGQAGFTFDMNFLGRTLHIAYELARACPDMTLILDHCGTPDIAGGGWDQWSAGIRRLAELPHVNVKLSGVTAYCAPGSDHAAATAPYIAHVIDCFTPARMVWGSDWPVCNLGAGLPGWLAITETVLSRLSADEAAAISHRNAARIYGVKDPVA
jgi:predicted TIM-barrel fold metal-dependent hydrolase